MNGGGAKQYTIEEVRQHNTKESAWSVINGVVYDFTKFLNSHPGGFNNIFRAIGKDGTQVFSKLTLSWDIYMFVVVGQIVTDLLQMMDILMLVIANHSQLGLKLAL